MRGLFKSWETVYANRSSSAFFASSCVIRASRSKAAFFRWVTFLEIDRMDFGFPSASLTRTAFSSAVYASPFLPIIAYSEFFKVLSQLDAVIGSKQIKGILPDH